MNPITLSIMNYKTVSISVYLRGIEKAKSTIKVRNCYLVEWFYQFATDLAEVGSLWDAVNDELDLRRTDERD